MATEVPENIGRHNDLVAMWKFVSKKKKKIRISCIFMLIAQETWGQRTYQKMEQDKMVETDGLAVLSSTDKTLRATGEKVEADKCK